MKIQCDVCNKDEASVFCTADEAALCDACDHRVHHANKLASKHQRFSLLHPSSKQFPLCDVCKERRAFLFCQEDRAILCRDCDIPIHTANEHTQKHNRFLLTGVKLSATSTRYTPSSSSSSTAASTDVCEPVTDHKSQPVIKNSAAASLAVLPTAITDKGGEKLPMDHTSSISEYLIETLPGWHVEEFLDSTYDPFGFCKSDDGVLPFLDADLQSSMGTFTPESSFGIWVPQSPAPLFPPHMAVQTALKETKEGTNIKANRSWMDDGFTVPQITNPSTGYKRSRPLW